MAFVNTTERDPLGRPPLKKLPPKPGSPADIAQRQARFGAGMAQPTPGYANPAAPLDRASPPPAAGARPPLMKLAPKPGSPAALAAAAATGALSPPASRSGASQGGPAIPVVRGEAEPELIQIPGKPPLRRLPLKDRRDQSLSGAGVDPGNARSFERNAAGEAKMLREKLWNARKERIRIDRDTTLDGMQRAQQLAALPDIPELEKAHAEANRRAADAYRLVTPDASDQTPEERLAAREALQAQIPGVKAALAGQAQGGLDAVAARERVEAAKQRRLADERSAAFRFPGMDMGADTGEAQRIAGASRDVNMRLNPGSIEGDIAAAPPFEQWKANLKQLELRKARERHLALQADAKRIPDRIDFGPDTTDTGSAARLAGQLKPDIDAYGKSVADNRAIADANRSRQLEEAKGAAKLAALQPQLAEAQINTEKAKAGTATTQAKIGGIQSDDELRKVTADRDWNAIGSNFDDMLARADALRKNMQSIGSNTKTVEIEAALENASRNMLEPLEALSQINPQEAAKVARVILPNINNVGEWYQRQIKKLFGFDDKYDNVNHNLENLRLRLRAIAGG